MVRIFYIASATCSLKQQFAYVSALTDLGDRSTNILLLISERLSRGKPIGELLNDLKEETNSDLCIQLCGWIGCLINLFLEH